MREILLIAFCVVAFVVILLVLLQNGKGAGMGSSFGAGASATIFGSSGSTSFVTKLTTIFGILFFVICLMLANLSNRAEKVGDVDKWSNIAAESEVKTENNTENSEIITDDNSNNSEVSDIPN